MTITRRSRRSKSSAAIVLVGALALVGVGCGDDDDDSSGDGGGGGEAAGDFCSVGEEIDAAIAEEGDLTPILEDLEASAPADVQENIGVIIAADEEAGDDGDPFEVEGFAEAFGAYADARIAECDYTEVAVTGVDFAFEGLPETMPAGNTAFAFENAASEEFHEILVLQINDDETRPLDELLALPEDEAMEVVTPVTAGFAPPGGSFTAFATLEPGRYAAVCFIPVGAHLGEEGPPHAVEGMASEFQVT